MKNTFHNNDRMITKDKKSFQLNYNLILIKYFLYFIRSDQKHNTDVIINRCLSVKFKTFKLNII